MYNYYFDVAISSSIPQNLEILLNILTKIVVV